MFRTAAAMGQQQRIETTSQLASVLKLPQVGNTSMLRSNWRSGWRLVTPGRMRVVVYLCEAVVATAVVACLVAIAAEPPLVRQVFVDPFGTLSEVMGRFL
jgi:hypothetical protein